MPETLNSVNIGIVTIGFNSVFQKSQDLFNKESNILVRQNPILKNQFYSLKKAKEQKYTDYKINTEKQKTISITETQKIQEEMNVRKVNTINTYKDAHSPADLSRLIDKQNDEGMKALEEILGTEALWKCILLTIIGTFGEIGKGTFDTLKIGEGAADFTLVYENALATPEMRLEAMLKGVGIDALRAMAIIPGAKTLLQSFAKVLNKIKIPLKSTVGGKLIGNEIGAVGDIKSLRKKMPKEGLSQAESLARKVEEMQYNVSKYKDVFNEKLGLDRAWIEIDKFGDILDIDYFIRNPEIRRDAMITLNRLTNYIITHKDIITNSNLRGHLLKSFSDLHRHLLPFTKNTRINIHIRDNLKSLFNTEMKNAYNILLQK